MAHSQPDPPPTVTQNLWSLAFRLSSSDWANLILQTWQLLKQISAEQTVGLYEVLDFEHALELRDARGHKAVFHKRATVRFLQDFVTAYQDQAWGLGDIFADYRCSPGLPVDRYRDGQKHRVLISLRETKRRGEKMRIRIDRTVLDGFPNPTGWSETEVSHKTRRLLTSVTFPRSRPPQRAWLLHTNASRTIPLEPDNTEQLPDGRQRVFWETTKPVLFETYTLKWTW